MSSPDETDDLVAILDRWEAGVRRKWDREDRSRATQKARSCERFYVGGETATVNLRRHRLSLDDYDGYVETHGQD